MTTELPERGDRVEFRSPSGSRKGTVVDVLRSGEHINLVIEFEDDGEVTTVRVRPSQIESVVPA